MAKALSRKPYALLREVVEEGEAHEVPGEVGAAGVAVAELRQDGGMMMMMPTRMTVKAVEDRLVEAGRSAEAELREPGVQRQEVVGGVPLLMWRRREDAQSMTQVCRPLWSQSVLLRPVGPSSDVPECSCGDFAVSRTVSKPDSAHAGRGFWTCAKPQGEQCGFFEWRDGDTPQAGPSRSTVPKRSAASSRAATSSRLAADEDYDAAPPRKRPRIEVSSTRVALATRSRGLRSLTTSWKTKKVRCGATAGWKPTLRLLRKRVRTRAAAFGECLSWDQISDVADRQGMSEQSTVPVQVLRMGGRSRCA